MRTLRWPDGETVPALGQGTWNLGTDSSRAEAETAALRTGIDLGMSLIDTAEMYGDGATERFLGRALAGLRDHVVLVSKAYPQNASPTGLARACEASLRRLRTDHLDLYLLHWRGNIPLAETVEGMEALRRAGKIRRWGVSNLDGDDMGELRAAGGNACATDQVLYNLGRRGPEWELLPWLAEHAMPAMAYSPVEQGRLRVTPVLRDVARRHGVEPLQVALAWVLARPGIIAIPKAGAVVHVRQNRAAAELALSPEDQADLDGAYPPPRGKTPLALL